MADVKAIVTPTIGAPYHCLLEEKLRAESAIRSLFEEAVKAIRATCQHEPTGWLDGHPGQAVRLCRHCLETLEVRGEQVYLDGQ